ncbi:putative metal-binding motif-containing protein, partial [Candidatus Woesearchaeota archaeon]|nr:putative metal-binding motif-containing protein [Candidatus Woesearchaeota archaeon]
PTPPAGCDGSPTSELIHCAICINPGANEICDGVDNDCNSIVNNGLTCSCVYGENQSCANQNGVCLGSTETCVILPSGEGVYLGCNNTIYYNWNSSYESPWETSLADGLDNNCDGFVDDNDKDIDWIADLSSDNCNPDVYCSGNFAYCYNPDQNDLDSQDGGDVCDNCSNDVIDNCTIPPSYSAGKSIDENGGSFSNPSGEVNISVPEGALDDDTSIAMSKGGSNFIVQFTGRGGRVVYTYELTSADTTFDQPVTLTFSYAGYGLTSAQIAALDVWYEDDFGNLQYADIGGAGARVIDTDVQTVTIQVNHFTEFYLMYWPLCCDDTDCDYGEICTDYEAGTECGETGYGVCVPEGVGPGDIPEFSMTTIILAVLIVGLGVMLIAKRKK